MAATAVDRLQHMADRITAIRLLLAGLTFDQAWRDATRWPAFERHIEVISEASRSIPAEWKAAHAPDIDWAKVAGIGSVLRHAYHHTSAPILWDIFENHLDPLESAINQMMAAHEASSPRSSRP